MNDQLSDLGSIWYLIVGLLVMVGAGLLLCVGCRVLWGRLRDGVAAAAARGVQEAAESQSGDASGLRPDPQDQLPGLK